MKQSELESLKKAHELEINYCAEHLEYFIENHCHIEDKDAPEVIVPFELWDGQKKALKSIDSHRLNIILKARQLGLTWLVLCYAVWWMIKKPGYSVVALSKTEDDAKELVRRISVILQYMGALVRDKDWYGRITYEALSLSIDIKRKDGLTSTFKSFSSSPSASRSFTANLVMLDEWAYQQYAREIWKAAFPTINRPTGGKVIGLSTIDRGTLFEDIFTGDFGFNKIFLPWNTDPRRTQKWYEDTKKAMGDDVLQEYPATVEEALTIPGGSFFPEMSSKIHLVPKDPIPSNYRRYVSIDYGLDMLAVLWYATDYDGNAVIYRQLHEIGLIPSKAAKRIKEETGDEKIDEYFAPPDLWNKNRDTGRSTAEIFGDEEIWLTKTSNDRVQGWLEIKEWLKPVEVINEKTGESTFTAKLVIQENSDVSPVIDNKNPDIWTCLAKIQKDKNKPNDAAKLPHELTHLPDSLRAFAAGRPSSTIPDAPPKKKKLIDILIPKKDKVMM